MSFDFVIIISFFFRLDPLWTLGHISNIRNSSVSSLQFPSPVGYFPGHTGMCGLLWVGFYHCKIYQNSPEIVKKWSRIVKNAKKLLEMLNNIQQKSNRYGQLWVYFWKNIDGRVFVSYFQIAYPRHFPELEHFVQAIIRCLTSVFSEHPQIWLFRQPYCLQNHYHPIYYVCTYSSRFLIDEICL